MTTYVGFELERVQRLQRALADSPDAASTLSGQITAATRRAAEIATYAAGLNPHQLGLDRETTPSPPGLSAVFLGAGPLAEEVQRRLTHLRSAQQLSVDLGFTFTGEDAFSDLPAMDEAKVKAVYDRMHDGLSGLATGTSSMSSLIDVLGATQALHGLNAGETDAVVAQLSDTEIAVWDKVASSALTGLLSPDGPVGDQLGADLFARLSEEQRERVTRLMPSLQPLLDPDHRGATLGELPAADIDNASIEDINQGELGDCWFLASIGAEMRVDPDFVAEHMRANANGTYTVTFYRDGKPVEVTVDSSVPTNGDSSVFTHGDPGWGRNGNSWPAIYEKAFAEFSGGYDNIQGGYGDQGMEALTGRNADRKGSDDLSFDDIQSNLDKGIPMTAGTKDHTTGHLWWTDHQEYVKLGDDTIVSLHEYTVVGVDKSADPPVVRLRNPWGGSTQAPEFVTMTEQEFHDNFNELSVG